MRKKLLEELALVAPQIPRTVATHVTMMDERDLPRAKVLDAQLFNAVRRDPPSGDDATVRAVAGRFAGAVCVAALVEAAGLGAPRLPRRRAPRRRTRSRGGGLRAARLREHGAPRRGRRQVNHRSLPVMRFDANDLLRIDGVDHVYVRPIEGGHVLRRHGCALETALTHADMARVVGTADFVHGRGHFSEAGAFVRQRSGVARLADIPPEELPDVMWKLWWVEEALRAEALDGLTRSDASMAAFVARTEAKSRGLLYAKLDASGRPRKRRAGKKREWRDAPRASTLRKWISTYEKGGCRAPTMRARHRFCGNRAPRLDPEAYGLIVKAVAGYASEKRPTVVKIREDIELDLRKLNAGRAKAGLAAVPLPSIKKVRKAVKALPAFTTYAARRGAAAARKKFLLVKNGIVATRPGERVEMDEWLVHLEKLLVESGVWLKLGEAERREFTKRYYANLAIDVATRCIVGLSVGETATSALALSALRRMASDKSEIAAAAGCATPWDMQFSPEMVVTDGGAALTSDATVAAIRDLGSGHDVPPGGQPEHRAHVERVNRTGDMCFLPYFTGRTFSNVEDKGDYDPQMRASLSLEAFCKALVRWVVDVYHNTPHEGLGGETPRQAWLRLTGLFGVIPPPAVDVRRAIFGVELERKVSLRGVRLAGLHYGDVELGQAVLRRGLEKVVVRFDPDDLGAVSLRVGAAWRRLPCRTEGLDGVSWETWTAAARDLRRRYADQAALTRDIVLDAIEAIKAIAAEAERSVGIDRLSPTADEVKRLEDSLLAGFDVPGAEDDEDPARPDDPFARAFETGGGAPPPPDAPTVGATTQDGEPPRKVGRADGSVPAAAPATSPKKIWIED